MEKPPVRAIRQVVYVPTPVNYAINSSAWVGVGLPPLNQNQVTAWITSANNQAQSCGFYVRQNHATLPIGVKIGVGMIDPPPPSVEYVGEFNLFNIKFTTQQLRQRQVVAGATQTYNTQGNGLEACQFVPLEMLDDWEKSANILTKFAQKSYWVPLGPVSGLAGAVWPKNFYGEFVPGTPQAQLLKGIYLLNVEIQ